MDKAPDAFRTISEVAETLETPAHVLRFWESRFPQIKPVKRAGGRRYYRPADVALLSGIRHLLHTEGLTICGVQKVLRDQGVRHVAALGGGDISALDLESEAAAPAPVAEPTAQVLTLEGQSRRISDPVPGQTTADVQPLFPAAAADPEPKPAATPAGDAGFIAFSNPRGPRARSRPAESAPPLQASLPLSLDPVPAETPALQAEPEPAGPSDAVARGAGPEPAAMPDSVAAPEAKAPMPGPLAGIAPENEGPVEPEGAQGAEDPAEVLDLPAPDAVDLTATGLNPSDVSPSDLIDTPLLAGLAARLRRMPAPVEEPARRALEDLHARLGLLHAQMAEALRLRR